MQTSDSESIYDEGSILESSQSIVSSVYDYLWENGRRYHAYRQGQYPFPNDEREQDRLDLMHCLWKELLNGRLFRSPIHQDTGIQRILDFGTGTANWALEVAELFPHVEILGSDLSPIQPIYSPSNCKFFIDDVESEWVYSPLESFDFIHGRAMAGSIGDWDQLLRRIHTHLKPGGWVELQEFECTVTSDDGTHQGPNLLREWCERLEEASVRFGKRIGVASNLRERLEAAGFVDVVDDSYKCPVGPWPRDQRLKRIGKIHLACCLEGIEPYSLALFTRILGVSYDKFQTSMNEVKKVAMNPSKHLYAKYHFIYGRKPSIEGT
ncbi:putative TAM domain methyltransferase [Talaromyces proteolyticus]|uniref:TAM domain methyltransferase n=1 Tax=Talaromyces proteolyticus TaxID=1131652 RepID=A0AAD4PVK9_9EURO|nr:putative TAM domain methyltransferase [Talaromyces proteolyticus]KAH8696635.1 putative TAM domain methyltransferase [Talaromyces proteolyticus]